MARGGKKVTVYTRAAEHPGHFRVDDGILLCVYCNHTVKWEKKSTVDDHVRGSIHCAKNYLYLVVVWKEAFQFIIIFWMKIVKIFQKIH